MNLSDYAVVANLKNDTNKEMRIFFEMMCEEVFLPLGQEIEILAKKSEGLLPITIHYIHDGLQIFANNDWDPDWHIRFNGEIIKPESPTRLSAIIII